MKTKSSSIILYTIAFFIIIIPVCISFTSISFSALFSKIDISTALVLLIIGKTITVFKKNKKDKSIPVDIGFILGLFITLIVNVSR